MWTVATLKTFWCRTCHMGVLLAVAPERCPNRACGQGDNWWTTESPPPRKAYNLTDTDMRMLRGLRIDPTR